MRVQLLPLAKNPDALLSYLDRNFRELSDALGRLTNVEFGVETVTGSVQIDTGLPEVYFTSGSLSGAPVEEACFTQFEVVGASFPKRIKITVYDAFFVESTTAIDVNWIAFGE